MNQTEEKQSHDSISSSNFQSEDLHKNSIQEPTRFETDHDHSSVHTKIISFETHDLPHGTSNAECWCCHCHLNDNNNNQYSVFANFFRVVDSSRSTQEKVYHLGALTWGTIDIKNHGYYHSSLFDRQFISILQNQTDFYDVLDENIMIAYKELLLQNRLPLPDQFFNEECLIDSNRFYLNYDGNIFLKDENQNYRIYCRDLKKAISFELEIKLPEVNGPACEKNLKAISSEELVRPYFIPRMQCNGTIKINESLIQVTGQCWYDHVFNDRLTHDSNSYALLQNLNFNSYGLTLGKSSSELGNQAVYQFKIQLDNGYNMVVASLIDPVDFSTSNKTALIILPNQEHIKCGDVDNVELIVQKSWTSIRTTCTYATSWKLIIPNVKCELLIENAFNNQEFLTILSVPGSWEGRTNVEGLMEGESVKGYAFMRCLGSNRNVLKSLDCFFTRISKVTLKTIANVLPIRPTYEQMVNLVANIEHNYLIEGLDVDVFVKTMISPIRDIIDRGGKAWRSFACLLCIDCVGNNSCNYVHWLSLAEIVHVGSLIIDDIQDESEVRRGGPACHIIHGTAQSITAGTAGYFLPLHTLIQQTPQLTPDIILRIYDSIFLTLRSAHVGQALDIHGLYYMMDYAVNTGDSVMLENAVLCIHRMKSGVPAGSLARIGALIGGGTTEQVDALENYIQSIGTSFQIIDDVLNLRGFQGHTKMRGEDIMAGKVTFPIAKAMSGKLLKDVSQREYVWNTLKAKPKDSGIIADLIELLEDAGCICESVTQAKSIVENAWIDLNPVIPDSFHKLLLRAFGLYVLQRYY